MARNDQPKMFTIRTAQKYFANQGVNLSTQQVRNLARVNPVLSAAITEYTDPVSGETYKVMPQSALDGYITWRKENPESVSKRGRAGRTDRRFVVKMTVEQAAQANELLRNVGLPELSTPPKQVRKPKTANTSDGNGTVSSDVAPEGVEELELIEVE